MRVNVTPVMVSSSDQFARIRSFQYHIDVNGYVLSTGVKLTASMFNIKVVAEVCDAPFLHVCVFPLLDTAPPLYDDDVHMTVHVRGFKGNECLVHWICALRACSREDGQSFMETENGMHTAYASVSDHLLQSIHVLASALSLPTFSAASTTPHFPSHALMHSDGWSAAQEAH